MRRSSRIQIKQEGSAAGPNSELSQSSRLTPRTSRLPARTIKVLSPKRKVRQKNSLKASLPLNSKKPSKSNNKRQSENSGGSTVKTSTKSSPITSLRESSKPKNIGENSRKPSAEHPPQKSNEKASFSGKTVKNESIPLLIQDDSNDSILSDVANSLKIDRTIKNLSPRKFFHNKDPKTTRSGRSFSPYDFASYSALFGSICANQANKSKPESKSVNLIKREKHEGVQSNKRNKHKNAVRRAKRERLRSVNKSKKPIKKNTKSVIVPPVEFQEVSGVASEVGSSPVVINDELLPIEKPYPIHFPGVPKEIEDGIFSEKVPKSFWLDFPFTRFPVVGGHSLPADFWGCDCEGSIPVCNWEVDWCDPKDPGDMAALSKVSLAEVDKYEFKSVFKDVSMQVATFEDLCGEWKPSPAYGKFDVMEAESAEGRRFYRKRITDTRLIAWHKYNLASSTRYCSEANLPKRRPVIKVRFNQCHKADLVWRLNQTQPPPSIEEIFNGPVVPHPDPKHTTAK